MPYTRPRTSLRLDFVTMDFDLPSADKDSLYVEISGGRIYLSGRYTERIDNRRFCAYQKSDYKFKADYEIPVPILEDTRYIKTSFDGDVLSIYMPRARESAGKTMRLYIR